MARVNTTIPDELLERARGAGLNVSRFAAAALVEEPERRAKVAALDVYLAEPDAERDEELDAELGPVPESEPAAAEAWAGRVTTSRPDTRRTAGKPRPARSA